MTPRSPRPFVLLALLSLSACAAAEGGPLAQRSTLLASRDGTLPRRADRSAQRRGALPTCSVDANCHAPLPSPRPCPHSGMSVATNCCRMGYCGICWSDCP